MENEIMNNIVEETMENNQELVETAVKSGGFGKGLLAGGLIAGAIYGVNKLVKYFKAKREKADDEFPDLNLEIKDATEDVAE